MTTTLVIVIKKPLVILDLWVVVMDLNSAKHVKVLSVALVYVGRWKKEIKPFLIDKEQWLVSRKFGQYKDLGTNCDFKPIFKHRALLVFFAFA